MNNTTIKDEFDLIHQDIIKEYSGYNTYEVIKKIGSPYRSFFLLAEWIDFARYEGFKVALSQEYTAELIDIIQHVYNKPDIAEVLREAKKMTSEVMDTSEINMLKESPKFIKLQEKWQLHQETIMREAILYMKKSGNIG